MLLTEAGVYKIGSFQRAGNVMGWIRGISSDIKRKTGGAGYRY